MDVLSLLRMLGALGIVLGLLAGGLWAVRRYDIKLPGRVTAGAGCRVELVERLPLDTRRSVALIRRDGREHLILIGPEGSLVVETGIVRDARDVKAAEARAAVEAARQAQVEAEAAAIREGFAELVERARDKVRVVAKRVSDARA